MLFHLIKTDSWKNIILDIKIYNSFMKKVNSYKYFGIAIDSNLNQTGNIEFEKKLLKSIKIY